MKMTALNSLLLTALLGVGVAGFAQAQAPEVLNPPTKSAAKKKAKKHKSQGANAKFISGSGETSKQRDLRLKRECKGQVNAGACAGYTR